MIMLQNAFKNYEKTIMHPWILSSVVFFGGMDSKKAHDCKRMAGVVPKFKTLWGSDSAMVFVKRF
jgi:hypothetical protein